MQDTLAKEVSLTERAIHQKFKNKVRKDKKIWGHWSPDHPPRPPIIVILGPQKTITAW
jgi:hypothetical protein